MRDKDLTKVVPFEIPSQIKQTGCTVVLAEFYDLLSLLITPVALASLFVVITMIALLTISRGKSSFVAHYNDSINSQILRSRDLSTKL